MLRTYCDLHNHLYGSIPSDLLLKIGLNNNFTKLDFFSNHFYKFYKKKVNKKSFLCKYKNLKQFKKLYIFNEKSNFNQFQIKFNLIIALCKFDREEIFQVAKDISMLHFKQNVSYVEYRLMYPIDISKEDFYQKTIAACEGLEEAEKLSTKQEKARLIISFHRDQDNFKEYNILKDLMMKNSLANKYIVGIDFCFIEEGYPPQNKKRFFQQILKDNLADRFSALSILYHVGESFQDKTLLSANRWILEAALYGSHRLGHCIALGINPNYYLGKTVKEPVEERIDQLNFELEHYENLKNFMDLSSKMELNLELSSLKYKKGKIEKIYDKKFIQKCYGFQNYVMNEISKLNTVIESCPTSNERIGNITNLNDHPLKRFVKNNLKVTISTDDPGIFDITILDEYEKAQEMGIELNQLEIIRRKSFSYLSEILSGRTA